MKFYLKLIITLASHAIDNKLINLQHFVVKLR